MSVDIDELRAAVEQAGGEHSAAAALSVHVTTVSRWLNGTATPPRTREPDLQRFIKDNAPTGKRPLSGYSSRQLMDELARRISDSQESNTRPGRKD